MGRTQARRMVEHYENRDVVGPDVVLDGEVHQPERRLEDDLVEGPAQERPVRVKDRVKAALDARVEDAADLLEQSRRADHAMSLRSPANDGRRSNRPEAEPALAKGFAGAGDAEAWITRQKERVLANPSHRCPFRG